MLRFLNCGLCFRDRLKLEALTGKEMHQQEEEEEQEESEGGMKGLQASQPQSSTNQLLLKEEELNIEEYSSDWFKGLCHTVLIFWMYRFTLFEFFFYSKLYFNMLEDVNLVKQTWFWVKCELKILVEKSVFKKKCDTVYMLHYLSSLLV